MEWNEQRNDIEMYQTVSLCALCKLSVHLLIDCWERLKNSACGGLQNNLFNLRCSALMRCYFFRWCQKIGHSVRYSVNYMYVVRRVQGDIKEISTRIPSEYSEYKHKIR